MLVLLVTATTAHMFWLCPDWRSFGDMYGIQIDPDPLMCIFGVASEDIELRKDIHSVSAFTTLLARFFNIISVERGRRSNT